MQIATKVGLAWKDGKVFRDSRPARIRKEIEDLLRRLRTDYIDLYQVHWPDLETPIAETARTLADLRRQGKIRAIGVSNYSPTQMDAFRAVASLDAVQPPYNLFEREIDADVLPYAKRTALTVLSYGALCRGLLSGRMTADTKFDGDDLRKVDPKFQGQRFRQYLAAVDQLKKLAQERFGKSVLALAVRWVLDQGPTIALWGARNPSQIDPIAEIDGWHIDATSEAEIDAILKRCITDPVSPSFMAPPVSPTSGASYRWLVRALKPPRTRRRGARWPLRNFPICGDECARSPTKPNLVGNLNLMARHVADPNSRAWQCRPSLFAGQTHNRGERS